MLHEKREKNENHALFRRASFSAFPEGRKEGVQRPETWDEGSNRRGQ
jgi:hypothetical protein